METAVDLKAFVKAFLPIRHRCPLYQRTPLFVIPLVIATLTLMLISCSKHDRSIIGKWEQIGGTDRAEFFADSTMKVVSGATGPGTIEVSHVGTFSFLERGRLKLVLEGNRVVMFKVAIEEDHMTITGERDGLVREFKRR